MSTTQPIRDLDNLFRFREYYQNEEYHPRNYALIIFGLNSALRISDILDLRWHDIFINGSYKTHIAITEKKTGKENRIILNNTAIHALEKLRISLLRINKPRLFTAQP